MIGILYEEMMAPDSEIGLMHKNHYYFFKKDNCLAFTFTPTDYIWH